MRVCDLCGEIDDGPRHVIAHSPGTVAPNEGLIQRVTAQLELPTPVWQAALAALADTTLQIRHVACCAATGCAACATPQEG